MSYTIKLDVNDTIFDKVMFFLKNIPVSNLEVKQVDDIKKSSKSDNIVNFFQNSPLVGDIDLHREKELYKERVSL